MRIMYLESDSPTRLTLSDLVGVGITQLLDSKGKFKEERLAEMMIGESGQCAIIRGFGNFLVPLILQVQLI